MAYNIIRYLISNDVWEAISSSHWGDYGGAPCYVTQFESYVLCSLQNVVPSKVAMFESLDYEAKFETPGALMAYKTVHPDKFVYVA